MFLYIRAAPHTPPPTPPSLLALSPSRPSTLIPFSHQKNQHCDFICSPQRERGRASERASERPGEEDSVVPPLRLCITASFCSIYSYSTVNHVLEKEREEREREMGGGNPEIADGSGIFYFFYVLILPHLNRRCGKALGAPLSTAASLSSKAANRA